ncbi:MAG: isochorismatase family protein [Parcubacteria group bacterium]|nr:isochorismatase family protein [Parcubacteria group bacterium]
MTTALIIVDPENDFCPPRKDYPNPTLVVPRGDEIVPPLNDMIAHARKHGWHIFVTFDWHPEDTEHFKKFGRHCVAGTKGAEPHPDLNLNLRFERSNTFIIIKGDKKKDDSFSGFDGHSEDGKSLLEILSSLGITELLIGGLATDYCVKATVLDALKHHFVVTLLTDACRALNEEDGKQAIREMEEAGAYTTTTCDFLRLSVNGCA